MVHSVNVCAGVVPAAEYRLNRGEELFLGVVGEIFAKLGFILGFELVGKRFEVVGVEVHVEFNALFLFHFIDEFFKILLADFHNDVGEHLNKSSVTVPSPAGVARFGCNGVYNFFVQAEIEDGVHHTGHRSAGAGADGNEKGVFLIAELLAANGFHFIDIRHYLSFDVGVDLPSVFIVLSARLGRNSETLRYGQTYIGHFSQVCTLAAQKFSHLCITFGKKVAILFCHKIPPSNRLFLLTFSL